MRRIYFESFGCQMNASDTEYIESLLEEHGFTRVSDPEESDVILVNTCSVREHAEQRAVGRLNDLSRHGNSLLVACGCMAQNLKERLFELVPGLTLISGPDNYAMLPSAIARALEDRRKIAMVDQDPSINYPYRRSSSTGRVSRFITVTRGCDNFCTYCIVPYLRGPVRSREPRQILDESREAAADGAREITFLGQNVMAYRHENLDFTGLLKRISMETEIARIRFLTTHPRDIDESLFSLMAENERICPHLHLPFQSGSNRILGLMKRGYTREKYLSIIARAREVKPGLAISTDIIVGFPGETEKDFKETLEIVERAGFDSAFTFKYSRRSGTPAAEMQDSVPMEEKIARLKELNSKVLLVRKNILEKQLGASTEILLDGRTKKGEYQFLKGRTPHFRNVLIEPEDLKIGDIVPVKLKTMRNFTFIGEKIRGGD